MGGSKPFMTSLRRTLHTISLVNNAYFVDRRIRIRRRATSRTAYNHLQNTSTKNLMISNFLSNIIFVSTSRKLSYHTSLPVYVSHGYCIDLYQLTPLPDSFSWLILSKAVREVYKERTTVLSNWSKGHKSALKVLIACLVTSLLSVCAFLVPPAYAETLSIQQIEKQSVILYEQLHHQKRSQAEINAALKNRFGLQPVNINKESAASTSTNSAIDLPTPSIFLSRGVAFVYADFNWNCTAGATCYNDPMNYKDVFGVWFTQNVPVASTNLSVSEVAGVGSDYANPTDFNQGGAVTQKMQITGYPA